MHCKKKICENVMLTIWNQKDTLKVWLYLQKAKICLNLHPYQGNRDGSLVLPLSSPLRTNTRGEGSVHWCYIKDEDCHSLYEWPCQEGPHKWGLELFEGIEVLWLPLPYATTTSHLALHFFAERCPNVHYKIHLIVQTVVCEVRRSIHDSCIIRRISHHYVHAEEGVSPIFLWHDVSSLNSSYLRNRHLWATS